MGWEFTLAAGLARTGTDGAPLEEVYEVQARDDEDPPHSFFWVQAGALRLERLLRDLFTMLPARVHVVLEVRRSDAELEADPAAPTHDRWASGVVARSRLLRVWAEHGTALVHDGMAAFGAYDPDSVLEVFLDDHKLVSVFTDDPDSVSALLARHGIPQGASFPTILDAEHEHLPLAVVRAKDAASRRAWGRRRGLDLDVFAPAIREALGMQRQQPEPDAEHADDEAE